MYWKLKVSGYGKIEHAEIEVAPLTLFVGDNNSGKSYLMSLLWGIQNFGMEDLLYGEGMEEEKQVADWMKKQIAVAQEQGICAVCVNEIYDMLQIVLDEGLKRNKSNLVKKIFNSIDVKIEQLQIILNDIDKKNVIFEVAKDTENGKEWLHLGDDNKVQFAVPLSNKNSFGSDHDMVSTLLGLITGLHLWNMRDFNFDVYLPAARTGFMLTKDIVNKVGRNTAFNLVAEQREVTPFIRPINQFLDVMNDLTFDGKGNTKFENITAYLESSMAEGTIEVSMMPNRDVLYVPTNLESGMPLRVVSAVVTELSPLILILKHKKNLKTLFYEEPEMCLHPQLQHKMARVICQLINAGLKMVITTHSDIVLQHINNMIRLSERGDMEDICQQYGYQASDLMRADNVKVYQLKSGSGGKTKVKEITCGKNGFAIPTFNEALDRIMEEAYTIQE